MRGRAHTGSADHLHGSCCAYRNAHELSLVVDALVDDVAALIDIDGDNLDVGIVVGVL